MKIRESIDSDKTDIKKIHTLAFGNEKGPEIATLVNDLFEDHTAVPIMSLVAIENKNMIGHILFTRVRITGSKTDVSAMILAPLAVLPDNQNTGIGGLLIKEGLHQLKQERVDLVFVLGHPSYYPRSGFTPAGRLGFQAPYPIPKEHANAWMVIELSDNVIGNVTGTVQCADVLNQPQHWRE